MLVEKNVVKKRWIEYFKGVLNVEEDREAERKRKLSKCVWKVE